MYVDFEKFPDRLIPSIVQDGSTQKVLMLGYMNDEALELTLRTGKVTFYSRSRREVWVKGETSGNFLSLDGVLVDCDNDTLLVKATPSGPACHTGSDTCFGETNTPEGFLLELERTIIDRKENPQEGSYTSKLFAQKLNKIVQKVGEEAVELVIAAMESDQEAFRAEAADLFYHLLVLFAEKGVTLKEINGTLQKRSRARRAV